MRSFSRALAALLVSSPLFIASLPGVAFASDWPQAHSDLSADPSIVFGALPNGMRYLIKPNATPPGAVSLRLVIDTGSLEETDAQAGIAHFVEHIVFRGSKHFADGEAFKTLQGVGVSRGADFNAGTGDAQTAYRVDLPKNDADSLGRALLVFRDIASEAAIDPAAVDTERAVVLQEVRQRDGVQKRTTRAMSAAAVGSDLARAMDPAGTEGVIEAATAEQLRAFYTAWYRPERATLLVVGDVDPKSVAAKIAALFGDWHAGGPSPALTDHQPVAMNGPHFAVFSETSADNGIQFVWPAPHDATPDSRARERNDLLQIIGLAVLNEKLSALALSPNAPFLGGAAAHVRNPGADMTIVGGVAAPGKALDALRAIHDTYATLLRDGVQPDSMDRAMRAFRAQLETQASAASATPTASLVGTYLAQDSLNDVIVAPQAELDMFNAIANTVKPSDVDAALHALLNDRGPLVFVSGPAPIAGGEAALAAAFAATPPPVAAVTTPPAPPGAWPYTSFGPSGSVASRTEIADLGVTQVAFANGVRASIKPTKFHGGQVEITARFGDGRMGLDKDRIAPVWAVGPSLIGGGLGQVTAGQLTQLAAGHILGLGFSVEDGAFILRAATRPEDYDFQLQLLAAEFTDPGWRPDGFARAQAGMLQQATRMGSSPSAQLSFHLEEMTHEGDVRWKIPSADEIQSAKLEDVRALYEKAQAAGSLELTVVGDISVDAAIKGIAATFGALPKHFTAPTLVAGDERFPPPSAKPLVLTHNGDASRAIAAIAWPIPGFFPDLQTPRTLKVVELLMAQRAADLLRTQAGMTYTPSTSTFASQDTPTYGYISIAAEIPLARIHDFYAVVSQITTELKTNEVPAADLARLRDSRVQDLIRAQETNAYWVNGLAGTIADPRRLDLIRSTIPDMQKVTPADVLQAARTYLNDDKAGRVVVVPEGQAGSVVTMR